MDGWGSGEEHWSWSEVEKDGCVDYGWSMELSRLGALPGGPNIIGLTHSTEDFFELNLFSANYNYYVITVQLDEPCNNHLNSQAIARNT